MQTFVVGVDGTPESLDALRWAQDATGADDRVQAIYVFQYPIAGGTDPSIPYDVIRDAAERRLRDILDEVPAGSATRTAEAMPATSPSLALIEASSKADVLLVGTRRHATIERAFVGSVALQCAQHATCPFIAIPEGAVRTAGRIAVAYDRSDGAKRALAAAAEVAAEQGRPLDVITVWEQPQWDAGSEPPVTAELEAQVREQVSGDVAELTTGVEDVGIRLMQSDGSVAPELLAATTDASLLVMGSRGHGGFAGLLLGSVSQRCLESALIPVCIVPD